LHRKRDLPTLGGAQTYPSKKEVSALLDLDTFIIAVFCLIDDHVADLGRLRARGPTPTLCDCEVITIEIIGEFLGLDEDTQLFAYFRRHYAHYYFPNLMRMHRTTFTRQPTSGRSKSTPGKRSWSTLPTTPHLQHLRFDALAGVPVRPRLSLCRRFRGQTAFGKDTLLRQTFYGFRVHVRICWPGVITRLLSVAPANAHELCVLPELAEFGSGMVVGGRRSLSQKECPAEPFSLPDRHMLFATQRTLLRKAGMGKRPLASRLLGKVLSHTVAFLLNHQLGNPPLQLPKLLT
jgi:hypothetical protein